jgi:hypothetical protein
MTWQFERTSEMSAVMREVEMWSQPLGEVPTAVQPETPRPPGVDGVDSLLHLLRYPEQTHPYILSEIPAPQHAPTDWADVRSRLCQMFDGDKMPCVDAYLTVRLALGVLWRNSIRLCPGPAHVWHWQEGLDQLVSVDLIVDTDGHRAYQLGDDLMRLKLDCYVRGSGFVVGFRSVHPYDSKHWPARAESSVDDDEE